MGVDATGPTPGVSSTSVRDEVGRRSLRSAWIALAAAFVVILGSMIVGPGDAMLGLVLEVTILVLGGFGGAVATIWFGVRAMRNGRNGGLAPLALAAFLIPWSLLVVFATFGRFYGWG